MDPAAREKIERRLNALIAADFEKLHASFNASTALCNALKEDFRDSLDRVLAERNSAPACRAVVRCFGSLVDGITRSMRYIAINLCQTLDEPLNPFLQEKTGERHLSSHQRIYSIYRLLADFLPKSPLAHLPDSRWDQLHRALEIRNRIVHPAQLADLELTVPEMKTVMGAGQDFFSDYRQFIQWCMAKEQQMLWDIPGTRKRWLKKIGRNEPCPCGSKRKYKNCCGVNVT